MNPNNDDNVKVDANCYDDNVKVDANCYYDDTNKNPSKYYDDCGNNNILSFYLWWKQVQVRVSDDECSDVIVDHHACDNDYNIHVVHDTVRDNFDLVYKDND